MASRIELIEMNSVIGTPPRMYGAHSAMKSPLNRPPDTSSRIRPPIRTTQVTTKLIRNRSVCLRCARSTRWTIWSGAWWPWPSTASCASAMGVPLMASPRHRQSRKCERGPASRPPLESIQNKPGLLLDLHREVATEPLRRQGTQCPVGVHIHDDLVDRLNEHRVLGSALVERHGKRLIEDRITHGRNR